MAHQIGDRSDRVGVYWRAARRDEQLVVFYWLNTNDGWGHELLTGATAWSAVELGRLRWAPCSSALLAQAIKDGRGQPPTIDVSLYEDAPIVPHPGWPGLEADAARRLVSAPASPRLVAYPGGDRLVLARRNFDGTEGVQCALLERRAREYRALWAIPARIAATPAAVAVDVVTAPAQVAWAILIVSGARGGWH